MCTIILRKLKLRNVRLGLRDIRALYFNAVKHDGTFWRNEGIMVETINRLYSSKQINGAVEENK